VTLCLHSDFFITEADKYRNKVWEEIKNHPNLIFKIITKRADRIAECLPQDWGEGYDNVILCVTVENQARAEERLPIVEKIPMKHRWIACTPMLEQMDLSKFLATGAFEMVEVLGERTYKLEARPIKHAWVLDMCE
jgi:protein gp37